jgi:hypothetical protein
LSISQKPPFSGYVAVYMQLHGDASIVCLRRRRRRRKKKKRKKEKEKKKRYI